MRRRLSHLLFILMSQECHKRSFYHDRKEEEKEPFVLSCHPFFSFKPCDSGTWELWNHESRADDTWKEKEWRGMGERCCLWVGTQEFLEDSTQVLVHTHTCNTLLQDDHVPRPLRAQSNQTQKPKKTKFHKNQGVA